MPVHVIIDTADFSVLFDNFCLVEANTSLGIDHDLPRPPLAIPDPPCAAHRALFCVEIACEILHNLSPPPLPLYDSSVRDLPESTLCERRLGQSTLASIARVCHTLSDIALDALWKRVDHVEDLLDLLPNLHISNAPNLTKMVIQREQPPGISEWLYDAWRNLYRDGRDDDDDGYLLPRLQELTAYAPMDRYCEELRNLSPCLRRLSIVFDIKLWLESNRIIIIKFYGRQDIEDRRRRRDEALRDIYWRMKKTLSGIEDLVLNLDNEEEPSENVPDRERVPWWTFSQLRTLIVKHTVNLTEQMTLSLMSLPALRKLCLTFQTYNLLPSPMATPRSGGFPSLHTLGITASFEDILIFFGTTGTIQSLAYFFFTEIMDTARSGPEDDPTAALTAIASALGPALDQLNFFLALDSRPVPLSAGLVLDALHAVVTQSLRAVTGFQLAGCSLTDADLHQLVAPAPLFPALVGATFMYTHDDAVRDRSRPPPGFHHPTVATVHAVSCALPRLRHLQLPSLDRGPACASPTPVGDGAGQVVASEDAARSPSSMVALRLAALEAAADVDVAPLAAALVAAFPRLRAHKLPLSDSDLEPNDRLPDLVACVTALQQGK
ncbi:uncharacterized protein BXZ73DRAFT_108320 [Epithele typhae]|uniref:uncharacterized protein n=1 Tax=Epithele typhae TaxID=378194 RepID=UPI0020082C36|nr:uncharacterized protein BXZ73DRAFT_108320 [Epithele typhae]KAH9910999.1 hypothetical protein BXZ73DRAFT_108320 [Epithele typhae]